MSAYCDRQLEPTCTWPDTSTVWINLEYEAYNSRWILIMRLYLFPATQEDNDRQPHRRGPHTGHGDYHHRSQGAHQRYHAHHGRQWVLTLSLALALHHHRIRNALRVHSELRQFCFSMDIVNSERFWARWDRFYRNWELGHSIFKMISVIAGPSHT